MSENVLENLKDIYSILKVMLFHVKKLHTYSTINTDHALYRCVNFHMLGFVLEGYETILATLIGRMPVKFVESGRFNKKGI